jgi:outer membrane protein OmpA-like peptidoglycan-associated protein
MGPVPYNLQLSQRRAEAVRRFLVQSGVELHRIQAIGLGVAPATPQAKTPPAQYRRVAVKLSLPTD